MKALLIDGLNLVRRIFSAVPGATDAVRHERAVIDSIAASINRALSQHSPTHVVGVFDGDGPSWRHQIFPRYKGERPPMPQALREALPRIVSAIEATGVNCLIHPRCEADDLLATIATKVAGRGGQVVILSTDTSLCQMLSPGIEVHDHFSARQLDEAFVRQRFGVAPAELPDLLSLVGVQSSSIPGVRGIGPKTASRLITEHGDLEAVLAAAGGMPGRVGQLLVNASADARLSRQLVTLSQAIEVGVNLSQFRCLASKGGGATIPHQSG